MREVSFWRLRMIERAVTDCTPRCSNRQLAALELIAATIAKLGRLVDDLIEGGKDVVAELNLSDCRSTCCRQADAKASNTLQQ